MVTRIKVSPVWHICSFSLYLSWTILYGDFCTVGKFMLMSNFSAKTSMNSYLEKNYYQI